MLDGVACIGEQVEHGLGHGVAPPEGVELGGAFADDVLGPLDAEQAFIGGEAVDLAEGEADGLEGDDRRDGIPVAVPLFGGGEGDGGLGVFSPFGEQEGPTQVLGWGLCHEYV